MVEQGCRLVVANGPSGSRLVVANGPPVLHLSTGDCNVRPLSARHSGHPSIAPFSPGAVTALPVADDVTVLMTSHPPSTDILGPPLDRKSGAALSGGVGDPSAAARRGRHTSQSSTNDRYNWQLYRADPTPSTSAGDCNRK